MNDFTNQQFNDQRKIGVAHLAFSLRTGGMERLLVDFAKHSSSDFRLNVYSLTGAGPLADELESQGATVTALNKAEGFRWSAVRKLAGDFRERDVQVVHTHNSGAMIYGALAAKMARVPCVVHTRHGQRFGASRRQNFSFACVSRLVDRVVGVSRDCADMSIREGVPARSVRTVWNGIDLSRFPYKGRQAQGPAVVVARLVPEKDHETLVRAASIASQRDPNFKLEIVGDGPCRDKLTRLIDQLGVSRNVEMLGERSDVPSLLQRASLFVLPSITEGISLTLLEAMATGLPVVATPVGGNTEVVVNGETGLLTPVGDPQQMASALLRVWQATQLSDRMGMEGRKRVEEHFDIRVMIRGYESIYRDVLESKQASGHRKPMPAW